MVWFWAWKMAWWMGFMIHDGMRISKLYYHPPESWHKWILIGGGFKMDSHPPDISAFSSDVILLEQRGNGIYPSICQFDSVPWTMGTWIPTQLHPVHCRVTSFFLFLRFQGTQTIRIACFTFSVRTLMHLFGLLIDLDSWNIQHYGVMDYNFTLKIKKRRNLFLVSPTEGWMAVQKPK